MPTHGTRDRVSNDWEWRVKRRVASGCCEQLDERWSPDPDRREGFHRVSAARCGGYEILIEFPPTWIEFRWGVGPAP